MTMFCLPSIWKDISGEIEFFDGLLLSLPVELRDSSRINTYRNIKNLGWGISEFGYSYFSFVLDSGDHIIFPGLIIEGHSKITKRFHGYKTSFTREKIEDIAKGISDFCKKNVSQNKSDQYLLVHDLRAISSSIYNAALEAERFMADGNFPDSLVRVKNIIASQGLLRMRVNALDFSGNILSIESEENIRIFKKVDKTVRCFMPMAFNMKKNIKLEGESYRVIKGKDVLELAFYALIENGLKYCPENHTVTVDVKDENKNTIISVSSFGPKILYDERESIFEKGVRGKIAKETGNTGSGIGLYMTKKIVEEIFNGKVVLYQDETSTTIQENEFFQTTFEVILH